MEDVVWHDRGFRYLEFVAVKRLMCAMPTTLLCLQAFFDYDLNKAEADNGFRPSPDLSIAVYDPALTLRNSVGGELDQHDRHQRLSSMNIDLALKYRILVNGSGAYDYMSGLTVTSTPTRDVVCTTRCNMIYYSGPCAATLFSPIPTFHRNVERERRAMTWDDVATSAGTYYSFVQYVAWVLSGLAFSA